MTEQEKQELITAVITQLKETGTDVSKATVVDGKDGVAYVLCYDSEGKIIRVTPDSFGEAENEIESKALHYNSLNASPTAEKVNIGGKSVDGSNTLSMDIPAATTEKAGVMMATDKKKLNNLAVEGANVDLNTYYLDGVYFFSSKRLTNVPILNDSVVSARLTVLTAYDGSLPVITQVLNLNNLGGGEGNIYIRSQQGGVWKPWGKLQANVEVGQISQTQMDDIINNGMYSGVCVDTLETFILVVINNYAIATATNQGLYISQLKYSVDTNGNTSVATRTRDAYGMWNEWVSLDEKSLVNEEKIRAMEAEAELGEKIEENKQLATNAPNLALRALFIAAGAEYNDTDADKTKTAPWGENVTHKAGHYYLNGLGDITEKEMAHIYNSQKNVLYPQAYTQYNGCRTYIIDVGQTTISTSIDITALCAGNSNLEVFGNSTQPSIYSNTGSLRRSFSSCRNLKHIPSTRIFVKNVDFTDTFKGSASLITVMFQRLNTPISFGDSPNISKDSILYLINKAIPTSAITITLHPDAYARLAEDADIVAALEAQPLVTLVSA